MSMQHCENCGMEWYYEDDTGYTELVGVWMRGFVLSVGLMEMM